MSNYKVTVLGAGLAGCEAALWLAGKGVQVTLCEQKPTHFSPAHKSAGFAELICSNSLKAERLDSASGLLKEEMRRHCEAGNTVFFSTHVLDVAEKLCDEIAIINKGKLIAEGTLEELRSGEKGASLEQLFLEMTGEAEEATV